MNTSQSHPGYHIAPSSGQVFVLACATLINPCTKSPQSNVDGITPIHWQEGAVQDDQSVQLTVIIKTLASLPGGHQGTLPLSLAAHQCCPSNLANDSTTHQGVESY